MTRKPVLILQHQTSDGEAYLRRWLAGQGIASDVRDAERGDPRPQDITPYSALAILGGEMSANDDLPMLRHDEALFLQAVQRGIPTLGHCLGGQLMARALGARVVRSPQPEIGWQRVSIDANETARAWFGDGVEATVFHWHYDAFELPEGAMRLATNAACPNQAFAHGPHLAMQFHVELDVDKLEAWLAAGDDRYEGAAQRHATVQTRQQMRELARHHVAAQQQLAGRIYARWVALAS